MVGGGEGGRAEASGEAPRGPRPECSLGMTLCLGWSSGGRQGIFLHRGQCMIQNICLGGLAPRGVPTKKSMEL